jgi:hypothetical protein
MFLDSSRYAGVPVDAADTRDGRKVTAIRLRPLPPVAGDPYAVIDRDRLDLLAQARYADGTRFWHIADANPALDARELTAETGKVIDVPRT